MKLILSFVRAELKSIGYSITKTDGVYRVRKSGSRDQSAGYFTDDLQDALDTGRAMFRSEGVIAQYGGTVTLSATISNVECWNMTHGGGFVLPAGARLRLEHSFDAKHTTCMAEKELFPCCYRWIVPNVKLNEVANAGLPEVTRDYVGEIIRAES